jgi:hypothetical protein
VALTDPGVGLDVCDGRPPLCGRHQSFPTTSFSTLNRPGFAGDSVN